MTRVAEYRVVRDRLQTGFYVEFRDKLDATGEHARRASNIYASRKTAEAHAYKLAIRDCTSPGTDWNTCMVIGPSGAWVIGPGKDPQEES
jgi:hypothetical protein